MDKNRVIGKRNAMPWYLPADLKHFKEVTMGHPIIVGSTTFASIGRPLPGRTNIVLSKDPKYKAEECLVAHSIEEALEHAQQSPGSEEIFFIGGAKVYQQALPLAERIYVTLIDHEFDGDVFFPEIDDQQWQEVSREDHKADDKNPYDYSFMVYERG